MVILTLIDIVSNIFVEPILLLLLLTQYPDTGHMFLYTHKYNLHAPAYSFESRLHVIVDMKNNALIV